MGNLSRIEAFAEQLTAIRRDFHAHPEIGFEERRTSGIVADLLSQSGIETHRGLGRTGVVGVLKGRGDGGRRMGLRADMDALPDGGKDQPALAFDRRQPLSSLGMTATPQSCSAPRAISPRRAISTAQPSSSSNRRRKGLAARAR